MRRLVLVPALVAALLLAGCASPATPGSAGSSTTTTGSASGSSGGSSTGSSGGSATRSGGAALPTNIAPIAPGEPALVGPAQIDATAIPGGYSGRVTLDLEGTGLTITGTEGSCSVATAELVGEDAVSVSVRLVVTTTSEGPCTAIAKLVPLTVQLAQPLGSRTVVLTEERR